MKYSGNSKVYGIRYFNVILMYGSIYMLKQRWMIIRLTC